MKVTVPLLGASINHILNIFQHTNNFRIQKNRNNQKCVLFFFPHYLHTVYLPYVQENTFFFFQINL